MAVLKYLQDVCDLRVSEKNKISLYKITQNVTVSYRINDFNYSWFKLSKLYYV